jgi:hypothetical protein
MVGGPIDGFYDRLLEVGNFLPAAELFRDIQQFKVGVLGKLMLLFNCVCVCFKRPKLFLRMVVVSFVSVDYGFFLKPAIEAFIKGDAWDRARDLARTAAPQFR